MSLTRRQFAAAALAAPLFAKIDSRVNGVMLGAQSYSLRNMQLDDAIKAMKDLGLGYVELWQGHAEPKDLNKEDRRKWRETVGMDHFADIKRKFDDAGITIYAFNYSFRDDFSEGEIARGFEMAKALGTDKITASSNVSTAAKVDPYARKAKVYVGMHNHSNLKDNEFARPEDFARAMEGKSKYIAVNLDIGHFTAANFDPIAYINQNHKRILTLHIKDRKKNQGANMEFGQGETPIREVLQLLKTKRYAIPAMIEYEYKGADTMVEMRKCVEYCKQALA